MTGQYPQPVVLDTTVLSNFASTDSIPNLTAILESPVVVSAVRDKLERGFESGHDYLDTTLAALDDELAVRSISSDGDYRALRGRLDPGEAASLLGAIEYSGTLATDDLAARGVADQRDVPITGSIGLLVLGVERDHIGRDTADEWLDTWRERRGYYAPVESVTEILETEEG